ncbi:MAG TPA: hypothetical protein ENN68_00605 [Methanomicrobia archaeon]|nr:hypothetical protein [Methanomicrobia archaeon]
MNHQDQRRGRKCGTILVILLILCAVVPASAPVAAAPVTATMNTQYLVERPFKVQVGTWDGNLSHQVTLASKDALFPLIVSLSYFRKFKSFDSGFGYGWRLNYDIYYTEEPDGVTIYWGHGGATKFIDRSFVASSSGESPASAFLAYARDAQPGGAAVCRAAGRLR